MEEGAVRVAIHRLRKRYRQLLRDEIAQTLADAADVDEEMRALFGARQRYALTQRRRTSCKECRRK